MINYDKVLNPNVTGIKPSGIRKYFGLAEQMDNVISLGVGEPDFQTPWHIREAGIRSLELGKTRYTANSGLMELRREITNFCRDKYNLEYDYTNQVMVTVGGSEAIDACIRAVVAPGDEVIIPEPSFVCYVPITQMAGGVPVVIETREEDGFRLTADALKAKITPRTKLLVLPFPNNPTGGVMRRSDLEAIADVLRGTDIMVLSDEIYGELTYGDTRHVSVAEIDGMLERTILVSGFSKTYSMTGWRLGFACGPTPIIEQMVKIHQFAIMSAPTTAQYAAIEALRNGNEDIERMREQYDIRRRFVVDSLRSIGLHCFEPGGAFYVFPSIKTTGLTSEEFCERLLYDRRVAVVPGNAFGNSGEGFIRISYSYSVSHLTEAIRRIDEFVNNIK